MVRELGYSHSHQLPSIIGEGCLGGINSWALLACRTDGKGDWGQREPSSKGCRFWQLGVRRMCTKVVRTKGSSRVLTSSAAVGVGGGEGYASQVESVGEGKGCVDSGAHT